MYFAKLAGSYSTTRYFERQEAALAWLTTQWAQDMDIQTVELWNGEEMVWSRTRGSSGYTRPYGGFEYQQHKRLLKFSRF